MMPAVVVRLVGLGMNGVSWLAVFVTALLVSYFWAAVFSKVRFRPPDAGWLPQALIFSMLLPAAIPFGFAALALSFGLVFGSHAFGGTGRYLVHPALLGAVFISFSYPALIDESAWIEGDPTAAIWFAVACLLGALWLIATRHASAMLVAGGVAGIGIAGSLLGELSPLAQLTLGHFAFALAFIATDESTQPKTRAGRMVFGLLFGFLTIVLRTANPDRPEGTLAALLLASLMVPLIDYLTLQSARSEEFEVIDEGRTTQ